MHSHILLNLFLTYYYLLLLSPLSFIPAHSKFRLHNQLWFHGSPSNSDDSFRSLVGYCKILLRQHSLEGIA